MKLLFFKGYLGPKVEGQVEVPSPTPVVIEELGDSGALLKYVRIVALPATKKKWMAKGQYAYSVNTVVRRQFVNGQAAVIAMNEMLQEDDWKPDASYVKVDIKPEPPKPPKRTRKKGN